jgi:hypothetical protein
MTAVALSHATSLRPAPRARLRITPRGRRLLAFLVALPLVVLAIVIGINGGGATATDESGTLTYVTVGAGDTLWQIAEELAPQSDPRDVIADIVSLNRLETQSLVAGESLAIPARYAH